MARVNFLMLTLCCIFSWRWFWKWLLSSLCSVASVMSQSWWPCGLQPARLLCPWDFPGRNIRVGCHFLFQVSSWPRDQNGVSSVSCIGRQAGRFFATSATWEAHYLHYYLERVRMRKVDTYIQLLKNPLRLCDMFCYFIKSAVTKDRFNNRIDF